MVGGGEYAQTDGVLTVEPGGPAQPLLAPLVSHRLAEILAGDGGPYAKRICVFFCFPTARTPCRAIVLDHGGCACLHWPPLRPGWVFMNLVGPGPRMEHVVGRGWMWIVPEWVGRRPQLADLDS